MSQSPELDVLFVNPGLATATYQALADKYTAIETPTWSLLLAQSVRSVGYSTKILDVNAERLDTADAVNRIALLSCRLICFVVYGQNPNSGTTNLVGAIELASALKKYGINVPIAGVGSHIAAVPVDFLSKEKAFDFIFCNEGVYALRNVLKMPSISVGDLGNINGIGYRLGGEVVLTPPEKVVPQERMDVDLPGYAWDLLPFKKTPLDLYRAHYWHAEYDDDKRTPFAAIYTSLGCVFKCNFCMINTLNRNDMEPVGVASNYAGMRFWSPEFMMTEFRKLDDMGVRTLRISDEMFLLNKKYFVPLCEMLREEGFGEKMRMWAYARVDTATNLEHLKLIREAGIRWLCLGIESANKRVRLEVTKGSFEDIDIRQVVAGVHDADINIIANYIFGLPGDDEITMQQTLDLSIELCTVGWNAYPAMALPGSQLYKEALENGTDLPDSYSGYSFHSYDAVPLPTGKISAGDVLRFRDQAFHTYHNNRNFLDRVGSRFSMVAADNIKKMAKIRLKRKLIGD